MKNERVLLAGGKKTAQRERGAPRAAGHSEGVAVRAHCTLLDSKGRVCPTLGEKAFRKNCVGKKHRGVKPQT